MTTDSSTTGDEQDPDADPEQMPDHGETTPSGDGVAEDDTEPGSDPDGDGRNLRSS